MFFRKSNGLKMIKLGIIGYPLGHSLSPFMHNAALQSSGIEGNYAVFETPTEKLNEQIKLFKEQEFKGFNVTIPHKVKIINLLDSIDCFAQLVGAVNTVVIGEDQKLHGYNTDVYGFVYAINEDLRINLVGKKAAVIGSGGAARAVLAGLVEMGLDEITIFARNQEKAEELKQNILKTLPDFKINHQPLTENIDLSKYFIVVNTTPIGMQGSNEGLSPLSESSIASLPKNAIVYDIVYKPRKTKLLELAEKQGLKTIDGLEMLILQGAKGFESWTGQTPPINIMREALISCLSD
jgi:shikimate dehydrogenase